MIDYDSYMNSDFDIHYLSNTDPVPNNSPYNIAICRLYDPHINGRTIHSSPNIDGQFMVVYTITPDEYFSYNNFIQLINMFSIPNIQQYSLEIIQPHELSGGECVACFKTFWLKILQRKCRRYIEDFHKKLAYRKRVDVLMRRKITGRW